MVAWDQIFGVLQAKTVHFYRPSPSLDRVAIVDNLLSSLGRTLAQFSPLAGRLRWVDGAGHLLEVDCNGKGAEVVEAECDGEMICFLDGSDSNKVKQLVPLSDYKTAVEDEAPLLVVQITGFRCGGLALGISMSHAVADGQSYFHFWSEWVRLSRGEPMKEAPHLDRTIFEARETPKNGRQLSFSDHIEFQNPPLLLGKQDSKEERMKETVKVVLPLTKAQLETLKNRASDNAEGVLRPFSRYVVVAAHIWRCACKARGHENEQPTAMSIAADTRNRIHTFPMPQRYFGNTIFITRAMSQAGELISNPLGFACGKIREAIDKVDEDYIWSNAELLKKKEDLSFYGQDVRVSNTTAEDKPFYGNPNLRVISWLTLPIYDRDFAWGDKINMVPIARDLDGSMVLLPGPKNDGSIVVVLCLQVAHVDKFKEHFYENIH